MFSEGAVTPTMREALISILYKGKGDRDLCKSHRPVSLTDATLRIIDKAIQRALNAVMPTVLDGTNRAFLPGEHIERETLSLAEMARWCHLEGGAAIAYLDLDKAYDRVRTVFLRQTLQAMGFPDAFVAVIDTMYADNWARLKVNGHIGAAFRQTNGLRQGLPSSCPLWLIYIEPFVRYLKYDAGLKGVRIPGELGRGATQHVVDAYADDVKCYCADVAEAARLLSKGKEGPNSLLYAATGQFVSVEKTSVILCGDAQQQAEFCTFKVRK